MQQARDDNSHRATVLNGRQKQNGDGNFVTACCVVESVFEEDAIEVRSFPTMTSKKVQSPLPYRVGPPRSPPLPECFAVRARPQDWDGALTGRGQHLALWETELPRARQL